MNLSEAAVYLKLGYAIKSPLSTVVIKAEEQTGKLLYYLGPAPLNVVQVDVGILLKNNWELVVE